MDTETLTLLVLAIVVLVGAGLLRVYGKWARRNPWSYETAKLTRTGVAVYGLFAVALFVGILGGEFLGENWARSELWFYAYIAVIVVVLVVAALVLDARGFPLTKDEDSGGV
jgi:uncharacterized membrane protein YidH (DUF202 family)